jgi:PDZ domain-containing protein
VPIDDQGMVHQGDLRLDFHYLVQKQAKDGKIDFEIIRSGSRMQLSVPVAYDRPQLMPWLLGDYPKYFIYGPLVFSPAYGELASGFAQNAQAAVSLLFAANPLLTRRGDTPAFPGEELVVIPAPFLPHRLVEGYGIHAGYVISEVNGIKIRNMSHLVEVLRDTKSEFVTFVFAGRSAETLVFPRKKMLDATEDILGDNGIREQGSPEYMQIWSGSGTANP